MRSALWFRVAAAAEIGGCYAVWAWWRLDAALGWAGAGMAALAVFALALAQVETAHAGRAFAAYGGVYIAASLAWMRWVEGAVPDVWDVAGAALSLVGAAVILFAPRAA